MQAGAFSTPSTRPWTQLRPAWSRPSGKADGKREARRGTGLCPGSHSEFQQNWEPHGNPSRSHFLLGLKPRNGAASAVATLGKGAQRPLASAAPRGLGPRTLCPSSPLPPQDVLKIELPPQPPPRARPDLSSTLGARTSCPGFTRGQSRDIRPPGHLAQPVPVSVRASSPNPQGTEYEGPEGSRSLVVRVGLICQH